MKTTIKVLLAATTTVLLVLPGANARAGLPYPTSSTPRAVDLGSTAQIEGDASISVTLALALRDLEGAQALLQQISAPDSATYHNFLTTEEFALRFGPSPATIEQLSESLRAYGLSVSAATTTTLRVSGTPAALEAAFQTSLHTFAVPAYDQRPGYTFHAPLIAPTIPAAAHAVLGLDTSPRLRPHLHRLSAALATPTRLRSTSAASTPSASGNPPGSWTVADFAQYYNVTPLYAEGVTGSGQTLGIVTFASFTPSDAYAYWAAVGLNVARNRIAIVDIDGGPGAPSDASGSDETTLDVEQSGGVAPQAHVVVYQAPNTNQGFVDAYAAAIDANHVQTLSISWGGWEWFNNMENSPVPDPRTGRTVSLLQALDELFLQAALQGQSLFASAGDTGAYDANDGADSNGYAYLPPNYSLALSVDSPGSDPYMTAAGGTTLASVQTFALSGGLPDFVVTIPQERVWSWDYLDGLCAELKLAPIPCGIFPVGGGGGVSVAFATPSYQQGLAGVQRSQPNQSFIDELTKPAQTLYRLPSNFAGRNVPDISLNADPDTGYVLYYTSDQTGFGIESFVGGTSFVGPQLNGTSALLGQYLHGRLGLLNNVLYYLAQNGGYAGSGAPLRAITQGSNDFFVGSKGYNPGAGLGVLNVGNMAQALKRLGE